MKVLREMQSRRTQLAIAVDEHGGVAGLITLEDLIEELVGDVFSEWDQPEQRVKREPSGATVVRGDTPIRDVNRELGVDLPEGDDYTTVAGTATGATPFQAQACKVPQLNGNKLRGAKKRVRKAHCKVGKVKKIEGATAKTGKVVKQRPKAGKVLAPGTKIKVTLAP